MKPTLYKCPVCKNDLSLHNKTWTCSNNHCYDKAKEGYVNLLLAHQKKTKNPGDNKLMIDARRLFLDGDFYKPLVEGIANVLSQQSLSGGLDRVVLDAGCGEGYYLKTLGEMLKGEAHLLGFDISKDAVRMAAKRYNEIDFFVASIHNIPVQEASVDVIVSVFSPINEAEFYKILKPNGVVITATPYKKHLSGLTKVLYGQHNDHNSHIGDFNQDLFVNEANKIVSYTLALNNNEDIMNLLKMTPYFYSSSKENSDKFTLLSKLETLVEFEVNLFRKK